MAETPSNTSSHRSEGKRRVSKIALIYPKVPAVWKARKILQLIRTYDHAMQAAYAKNVVPEFDPKKYADLVTLYAELITKATNEKSRVATDGNESGKTRMGKKSPFSVDT